MGSSNTEGLGICGKIGYILSILSTFAENYGAVRPALFRYDKEGVCQGSQFKKLN